MASEALRSLEIYDNQLSKRAFQDISVKYLNGYIDFCRAKGNSDTTLKIRLGEIRRIYNIAIREGVASQELYPFSNGKEDGKVRQRFNHSLRQIAKELGFPESQLNITSYTARHSFAMTMLNMDKPVEIISQALGHQSVETTKYYLAKFSSTKMAKETDIDLSY